MLNLDEILSISAEEPQHIVRLTGVSLILLLSAYQWIGARHQWTVAELPPIDSEWDTIQALVALAETELMTNPLLGAIFPMISASVPDGALECDGATYNRVDWPDLYAALDTPFIVDADTFVVPDLRSRTIIGAGTGTGLSVYAVNDSVGEETHVLATAELAVHGHAITDLGHAHTDGIALPNVTTIGPGAPQPTAIPGVGVTGVAVTGISIQTSGNGDAHENRQPSLALRYAVWAI